MSHEQQTANPGETSDAPQLKLTEFIRVVCLVFGALAAQKATSPIAESYERMHREADAQLKALEAQIERDADWVADAYDDHLRDLTNRYFE